MSSNFVEKQQYGNISRRFHDDDATHHVSRGENVGNGNYSDPYFYRYISHAISITHSCMFF